MLGGQACDLTARFLPGLRAAGRHVGHRQIIFAAYVRATRPQIMLIYFAPGTTKISSV